MSVDEATVEELAAFEVNKTRTPLPDPSQYDDPQDTMISESKMARALVTTVARTPEADAFLKHQIEIDSHAWHRLCQMLQRSARNVPALASSAFISAQMTPDEYKVKLTKPKRGLIGYSWNPNSPGAGHVFEICGQTKAGIVLTRTNDAFEPGAVDVVHLDFYKQHWGHELQFFASWINGFEFPDFHTHVQQPKPKAELGKTFDASIRALKASILYHDKKGHDKLVRQLNRQLERMEALNERWK